MQQRRDVADELGRHIAIELDEQRERCEPQLAFPQQAKLVARGRIAGQVGRAREEQPAAERLARGGGGGLTLVGARAGEADQQRRIGAAADRDEPLGSREAGCDLAQPHGEAIVEGLGAQQELHDPLAERERRGHQRTGAGLDDAIPTQRRRRLERLRATPGKRGERERQRWPDTAPRGLELELHSRAREHEVALERRQVERACEPRDRRCTLDKLDRDRARWRDVGVAAAGRPLDRRADPRHLVTQVRPVRFRPALHRRSVGRGRGSCQWLVVTRSAGSSDRRRSRRTRPTARSRRSRACCRPCTRHRGRS